MFDMYCIERIKTLLYYYCYYYYYYYYMYYERKKVKLQSFVHVCSNELPWNWSWHNKHLHYHMLSSHVTGCDFFSSHAPVFSCLLPSNQIRERDACIVPLLILCSCVHLHIFWFYSDTWKCDVLTTLEKDVRSYFRFYS